LGPASASPTTDAQPASNTDKQMAASPILRSLIDLFLDMKALTVAAPSQTRSVLPNGVQLE
jgi:hypothetical protein